PSANFGLQIDLKGTNTVLRPDYFLFSESSGFVFEVRDKDVPAVERLFHEYKVDIHTIGRVTDTSRLSVIWTDGKEICSLSVPAMRDAWENALTGVFI
ncbi:MAG TPA: AIR synthase-related protein, partial [bacterium]|nr:AIR synthase-related protein [bacterium]